MRSIVVFCVATTCFLLSGCRSHKDHMNTAPAAADVPMQVEAGCATCIYDMPGVTGCVLAVKIDGKAHLVKGVDLDDLGDAHAADGLCNTARQATARGRLEGDTFVAGELRLKP